MDTQNINSINTPIVENHDTLDELEALRKDYAILKERLDKQDIVNEKLLLKTFDSKVKTIHTVGWKTAVLGVFVILVSPFVFHYNPAWDLSWAFVIGTDIMMLFCIYMTWRYHSNLASPRDNEDLVRYADSVKKVRDSYKNWMKYAYIMIAAWLIWMGIEIFNKNDEMFAGILIGCAALGGIVGGIIGYRMDMKVIRNCEEIISDIENIDE